MGKRIVVVLILLTILLSGCTKMGESESRFVRVETDRTMSRWVVYDKYTKVMYVEKLRYFTPLYNADGSLLLWDGE